MPPRRKLAPGVGQEVILFDDPPSIPREYDLKRAQEAANRRKQRHGYLALTPRTRGFIQKVSGLWIPSSSGEITAVVPAPESKIRGDTLQARERVKEKYNDTDVDPSKVERWASFSAENSARLGHINFRKYKNHANQQRADLYQGLEGPERTFSRGSIEGSDVALSGLASYVISLESFVGETADTNKAEKRKWIHEHWTRKFAENKERVLNDYVSKLNEAELLDLFDEATFSSWSRFLDWTDFEMRRRENQQWVNSLEPDFELLPIEAYLNDPEASGHGFYEVN